jgi:aminoglycoside phosphotransferase (APT) family kinase protein
VKGLDLERLQDYLGSPRELTGRMFAGGRSNLTYAVTDGENRWVLRRPPLGTGCSKRCRGPVSRRRDRCCSAPTRT